MGSSSIPPDAPPAQLLIDPDAHPVIAHRGASGYAPENTLPSFQLAVQQGADALEFDVRVTADGIPVLIPPDSSRRRNTAKRPGWNGGAYDFMRGVLETERGSALYRQRGQLIEPVFGHTKHNRGFSRFHRRGRSAARTEWRLMAATHNLVKLHRHFNDPGG